MLMPPLVYLLYYTVDDEERIVREGTSKSSIPSTRMCMATNNHPISFPVSQFDILHVFLICLSMKSSGMRFFGIPLEFS